VPPVLPAGHSCARAAGARGWVSNRYADTPTTEDADVTTINSMASPTGRVLVVAPRGDLAVGDCAELRQALRAPADGVDLLVVDLLDVDDLDEAVVEVLVGTAARCRAAGTRFIVANAGPDPWMALTKARLAGVLKLHRRGTTPLSELLQLLEL